MIGVLVGECGRVYSLEIEDASTDDRSLLQRVQTGKPHDYKEFSDLESILHSTILKPKETRTSYQISSLSCQPST
jgi:hypothetical protein